MCECVVVPKNGVTYVETKVIPDQLLTFLGHLSPAEELGSQRRIACLLRHNSTCTANTYGALLACLEYRTLSDVPVALLLRHVVCEAAHVPHRLREGYDVVIQNVLEAGL